MITETTEPSLQGLLRIFSRRRRIVGCTALCCIIIAIAFCVSATRRYQAASTIEVQNSSTRSLGLDSLVGGMSDYGSDPLSANFEIQTQINILQSEHLAMRVVKDLRLDKTADFKPRPSAVGFVMSLFSPKPPLQHASDAAIRSSAALRERLFGVFSKNLKVRAVAGSRLIEVSYSNPDPQVAANVVNNLVKQLIDYTFQVHFKATTDVSNWLEVQLGDLRHKTEALQAKLVSMQKDTNLYGIGGTDLQGKSTVYSPVLDRLQRATVTLAQAEYNSVITGAVYHAAETGNAELLSQLSGPSIGGLGGQGVVNSFNLIQTLRSDEARLQSRIAEDSEKFDYGYPKLIEEKAALARVERSLQDEIGRVKARAKTDYEVAEEAKRGADQAYESDKQAAARLNTKTIEFTIVEREANQSQDLYQDLLKRLRAADIIEGLHSSNFTVVEEALPPAEPNTPNVRLVMFLGTALGLALGGAAALLIDSLDTRVIGPEDVEMLGFPLLGVLPRQRAKRLVSGTAMLNAPASVYSEAVRKARSAFLASRGELPPKVVLVTSAIPAEGKTTLCVNMALALAQHGTRVLVIEGDMRSPTLRDRLGLDGPMQQLTEILDNSKKPLDPTSLPVVGGVSVLPAGPVPPNPAELLSSPRFGELLNSAKDDFEFILVDAPPALQVVDAQLLADHADAIILVARSGLTTRNSLKRTYEQLVPHTKRDRGPAIRVVLNALPTTSSAYHQYYGSKRYIYGTRG